MEREQRGRLVGKSISHLSGEGAETIFRGRWTDKEATSLHPGTYQVDLIVLYPEGAKRVGKPSNACESSRSPWGGSGRCMCGDLTPKSRRSSP